MKGSWKINERYDDDWNMESCKGRAKGLKTKAGFKNSEDRAAEYWKDQSGNCKPVKWED
jgi:hypothetical protein